MAKALDIFFRVLEYIMAVFLAMMVSFMLINVVMRFIFNSGLAWSEEVARLAFIFLVYLGTIGAFRDNRHLGVNTLLERLPLRLAQITYIVVQGIIVWVMYLLVMGSISLAGQSFNDQWVATQFPRWIVSGVGALTGVAIIILALANIIRMIRGKTIVELLTPTNDDSAEALYKDGDTNNSDVIIAAIERFERAGEDHTIAWNGEEK
ncbi:TRAP transporter small permease [Trueperella pyogenes]|uniref:TRAP transporter small permease n=1 Tax=Trueperella pyogenes TaxID=1661 RepID=UPI00312B5525